VNTSTGLVRTDLCLASILLVRIFSRPVLDFTQALWSIGCPQFSVSLVTRSKQVFKCSFTWTSCLDLLAGPRMVK